MAVTRVPENVVIGKETVLKFLEDARELKDYYDRENSRNPSGFYDYSSGLSEEESIDAIAIRKLEESEGIFFTDIKLNGSNIKLSARQGSVDEDGNIRALFPGSVSYSIQNFNGTTVARFTQSLCKILRDRATGNAEIRNYMDSSVGAYITRTLRAVEKPAER